MLRSVGTWLLYLLGACGILLGLLLWVGGESDWGTILQFGAVGAVLISIGRSLAKPAVATSDTGTSDWGNSMASEAAAADNDADSDSDSDPD